MKNPEHLKTFTSYIDDLRDKNTLKVAESEKPFRDK